MLARFTIALLALAAPALAQSTQPADLIERLGDRSPAVRQEAVQQLKAIGVPALPLLRRALRSDDPQIAAGAAEVMRQLPRTRPGDPPDIVSAARRAGGLIALGTPEASAAVYRLLLQEPDAMSRWTLVSMVPGDGKFPPVPYDETDFADDDGSLACAAAASRRASDANAAFRLYDQARPLILRHIASLPDEQVRPHVAWNLARGRDANDAVRQANWLRVAARLSPESYRPGPIPLDVAELYRLKVNHPGFVADPGDVELFAPHAGRPLMLYGAARLADRRGQPQTASLLRTAARSLNALTPSQRYAMGEALIEMQWYDEAIVELESYIRLPWLFRRSWENYPLMRSHLAIADIYGGRYEHATASPWFTAAAAYVEEGVSITAWGKSHRGTAAADELRRLGHYHGLCAAIRVRDWSAADAHERGLAALSASATYMLQLMAWNATRAGREADAVLYFDPTAADLAKAVADKPDDPAAINRLAWFLACSGRRLDEAVALAQRATRLDPNAHHFDTLAEAHHQLGDTVHATEAERKAIELKPDFYFLRIQLQRFERREGSITVERLTPSPPRGEGWGEGRNAIR